jgi:flagellar hook-associated protein 3 FlgL
MAAVTRPTFLGQNRGMQQRLNSAFNRFTSATNQVASMKAFERPSDDPVAASQAALLQQRLDHLQAVGKSTDDAMARLNITDSKLTQAGDNYNRMKELMLQAANGVTDAPGRAAIASELRQIRDGLAALANSDYLGLPLFAGLGAGNAVEKDGGGNWIFNGAAGDAIERRISPTESIQVNVTAAEAFSSASTDIFTLLDVTADALDANDTSTIPDGLASLEELRSSLFSTHATIGAAANRVETAIDRNATTSIAVENQLSLVRDVDLADAITRQQMLQTAYQAALQITGKTAGLSIMDFMR